MDKEKIIFVGKKKFKIPISKVEIRIIDDPCFFLILRGRVGNMLRIQNIHWDGILYNRKS